MSDYGGPQFKTNGEIPKNVEPVVNWVNDQLIVENHPQDQTTAPVEYWLSHKEASFIFVQPFEPSDNEFFIDDVTVLAIGCYVEIEVNGWFYQGEVLIIDIPTNSFRVDIPISFPGNTIPGDPFEILKSLRVCVNLAETTITGVGTLDDPVEFSIEPPIESKWDLTRSMHVMILDSGADDGKFGNIAKLTNGIYFGFVSDIEQAFLVNIKDNSDYRSTCYDVQYTTRSGGGGDFGMAARKTFGGLDKYGVVIRLDGASNDRFIVRIQDDLSDLVQFKIKLMGHVVED